ncbi:MAG: helix-turn-helix domain-containing protein [Puniceicoccales bacterium]|jgi:excisionase family DNA binding protein|nr:helix-turn-helix domain-containing protein [Puniceicoccales bacterium]
MYQAPHIDRLHPALFSNEELANLTTTFSNTKRLALSNTRGKRVEVPETLARLIAKILHLISEGKAVTLIPDDNAITTQTAANYLGMSRQHFVGLVERGEIPHHKVGTHRRVAFSDVLAYEKKCNRIRRNALNRISDAVDAAGHYNADYTGT